MTPKTTAALDILSLAKRVITIAEDEDRPFIHLVDADELLQYKSGVYRVVTKAELAHLIEELEDETRNQTVNEVFDKIRRRSMAVKLGDFDKEPWLLNVKNGIVDLRTGAFRAHDWNDLTLSQLDVRWDPLARSRRFEKFLKRVVPENADRLRFLDMWASCLYRRSVKKDMMLIGETDSGKSTLLELVRRFLGAENVSSVSLQELDSDRFSKADLFGKLANIHADIDDQELKRTSGFKTTNGGDQVRAQRKFGHAFNFVPTAKRFYSCNKIPTTKDESDAFFNRWIIVHFSQVFVDVEDFRRRKRISGGPPLINIHAKDYRVLDRLLEDNVKSAILNVLVARARRVIEAGCIPNAPSIEETRDAWLFHSDQMARFIDEMMEDSPDGRLSKAEVYRAYSAYCNTRKMTPKSEQALNAKLKQRGAVTVDGKPDGKHTVKQWKGIRWKANNAEKTVELAEGKRSAASTEKPRCSVQSRIDDASLEAIASMTNREESGQA